MDNFEDYLDEVCLEYLGFKAFSLGSLNTERMQKLSNINLNIQSNIKLKFNCRNKELYVQTVLFKMLLLSELPKEEYKEVMNLNLYDYPNQKLIMSDEGFNSEDLVGAVINNKLKVPPKFYKWLDEDMYARLVDTLLSDVNMLNEDCIVRCFKQLNLAVCTIGFFNKLNVGVYLYTLELIKQNVLNCVKSGQLNSLSLLRRFLLTSIFNLASLTNKYCDVTSNYISNTELAHKMLIELDLDVDNTKLNILYDLFDVDNFSSLISSIKELYSIAKKQSEFEKLKSTNMFYKDDIDKCVCDLRKQNEDLKKELDNLSLKLQSKNKHIEDLNRDISRYKFEEYKSKVAVPCVNETDCSADVDKEDVVLSYLNSKNVCSIGGYIKLINILNTKLLDATIIGKCESLYDDQIKFKDVIIINTINNCHGHSYKVRSVVGNNNRVFIISAKSYSNFIEEVYDYVCHLV